MVDTPHHENSLHINVYEMLRDHSGWFIKYQVDLHELFVAYPDMTSSYSYWFSSRNNQFRVLDFVRGEEEEGVVVKVPFEIKRINLQDKSFKQLFDIPNVSYGEIDHSEVHRYIETLGSF